MIVETYVTSRFNSLLLYWSLRWQFVRIFGLKLRQTISNLRKSRQMRWLYSLQAISCEQSEIILLSEHFDFLLDNYCRRWLLCLYECLWLTLILKNAATVACAVNLFAIILIIVVRNRRCIVVQFTGDNLILFMDYLFLFSLPYVSSDYSVFKLMYGES